MFKVWLRSAKAGSSSMSLRWQVFLGWTWLAMCQPILRQTVRGNATIRYTTHYICKHNTHIVHNIHLNDIWFCRRVANWPGLYPLPEANQQAASVSWRRTPSTSVSGMSSGPTRTIPRSTPRRCRSLFRASGVPVRFLHKIPIYSSKWIHGNATYLIFKIATTVWVWQIRLGNCPFGTKRCE